MNCDQAFEFLGEPGPPRAELDSHLKSCPRCRQLQDVLSPLLEDDGGEYRLDPVRTEPSATTWAAQAASAEAVTLAQSAARSLTAVDRQRRYARTAAAVLSYAAVFLFGASVTWLSSANFPSSAAGPISHDGCTRGMVPSSTEPRGLVLTCVACHLEKKVSP